MPLLFKCYLVVRNQHAREVLHAEQDHDQVGVEAGERGDQARDGIAQGHQARARRSDRTLFGVALRG